MEFHIHGSIVSPRRTLHRFTDFHLDLFLRLLQRRVPSGLGCIGSGASPFCRVSTWHVFGGSASTAHASPPDDFLFCAYNASCGVPRIAFFGCELGVGGSFLWDLAVVSLMTAIHFGTLEGALPFCFDVRLI